MEGRGGVEEGGKRKGVVRLSAMSVGRDILSSLCGHT